jgi:hypothetical protein
MRFLALIRFIEGLRHFLIRIENGRLRKVGLALNVMYLLLLALELLFILRMIDTDRPWLVHICERSHRMVGCHRQVLAVLLRLLLLTREDPGSHGG